MRSFLFLAPRGPKLFFTHRFHKEYKLSLLGSSRSSPNFAEDLENTEFPFWALKYEKNENFHKSVKIFVFQDYRSILGIITKHSELWNIDSMPKFFFGFFFQNFFELFSGFSGFVSDFWDNSFLEILWGPGGIDFILLDPQGMLNHYS